MSRRKKSPLLDEGQTIGAISLAPRLNCSQCGIQVLHNPDWATCGPIVTGREIPQQTSEIKDCRCLIATVRCTTIGCMGQRVNSRSAALLATTALFRGICGSGTRPDQTGPEQFSSNWFLSGNWIGGCSQADDRRKH